MSALRELLVSFGVEVDDKELDEFEGGLGGVLEKVTKVGGAIAAAFAVGEIKEFFGQAIEAGAHLGDLSEKLGVGTEELQQWQFAARLAGVEGEAAAHSLQFLNKAMGEALGGSAEAAGVFSKLGVAIKDPSGKVRELGDVIPELADSFKDMGSQQERTAMAMKLFGREGAAMVPILMGGSEEIEKLNDEFKALGGGMSDDFVKQAKKTDDEIAKLDFGFKSIKTRIVAEVLPGILKMVQAVEDVVKSFIKWNDSTHALAHAWEFLKGIGIIAFLYAVATALAGLTLESVLAALPWIALAAAVVLMYLAFNELKTAVEGGDTVLGDFIEKTSGIEGKEKFVEDLRAAWQSLSDTWVAMKPAADSLLSGIIEALPVVIKGFGTLLLTVNMLAGGLSTIAQLVGDIFKENPGANWGKILQASDNNWQSYTKVLGDMWTGKPGAPSAAQPGPAPVDFVGPQQTGPAPGERAFVGPAAQSVQVPQSFVGPTTSTEHRQTTVNQTNTIKVEVKQAQGEAGAETGRKVGVGVATELESEKYNALQSVGSI